MNNTFSQDYTKLKIIDFFLFFNRSKWYEKILRIDRSRNNIWGIA